MAIQDVERAIKTTADAMASQKRTASSNRGVFRLKTSSGYREVKRPEIIRTPRVNGMVLTRDEVRAFARLKARGREMAAASKSDV